MSNIFFKNKLFNLFFSETWAFQVPREHDKISLLESLELWISVKIVLQQRVKNIRKVFFMIFFSTWLSFVCCNRCLWKKAIYHVTFALKRSVITNIEQWWNSSCSFRRRKDKEAFLTLQDKKGLKKGVWKFFEGILLLYTLLHVLLLMYPYLVRNLIFWISFQSQFETFLLEIQNSSWGSADFQWILLHNFLMRNWH